eukprot:1144634-Pelagomonas_calceolata.AAC.1
MMKDEVGKIAQEWFPQEWFPRCCLSKNRRKLAHSTSTQVWPPAFSKKTSAEHILLDMNAIDSQSCLRRSEWGSMGGLSRIGQ